MRSRWASILSIPICRSKEKRHRTQGWFEGFRDFAEVVPEVDGETCFISVYGREADIFELFDTQRHFPCVEQLARAKYDRDLGKGRPKLFALMSGRASYGLIDIKIERLTERPKTSLVKARLVRQKRLASCELRFRRITLPSTGASQGAEPVSLYGVHVRETVPPEGEDRVQWFLLTTERVCTAKK